MKKAILAALAVMTMATGVMAAEVSYTASSQFEGMSQKEVIAKIGKPAAVLTCSGSSKHNSEVGCPDGGTILFYSQGVFTNNVVFDKAGYVVSFEPRYWSISAK